MFMKCNLEKRKCEYVPEMDPTNFNQTNMCKKWTLKIKQRLCAGNTHWKTKTKQIRPRNAF